MIKPFVLMATAATMIATFLLIWDSPPESFLRQPTGQVEQAPVADSYMRDVQMRAFSVSGTQQFAILAEQIDLFTGKQEAYLVKPLISSRENSPDQLSITASLGVLDRAKNRFMLSGDVRLETYPPPRTTVLTTDQLSYFGDTGLVASEALFELTNQQARIRGKGLTADIQNRIYRFEEQVSAAYDVR